MQHAILRPNLVVVACGEPARVVRQLQNAKVEVQIIESHRTIIVDVDDLKFLPTEYENGGDRTSLELQEIPSGDDASLEDLLIAKE